MKKYITEFIGTFFLVLVIGLSGNPIAIGGVLMIMVYMGGHISGAHYNPAVSLAMLLQKEINAKSFLYYTLFQILGAFLAASFACQFHPTISGLGMSTVNEFFGFLDFKPSGNAYKAELIWTFALVLVIFNVACSKRTKGNSYYGLAIGSTVAVGAYIFGDISGAVFNPAAGIGPMIVNSIVGNGINKGALFLYTVFPILGGILAYYTYNFINSKDSE